MSGARQSLAGMPTRDVRARAPSVMTMASEGLSRMCPSLSPQTGLSSRSEPKGGNAPILNPSPTATEVQILLL